MTVNGQRSVVFIDPPAFCTTVECLVAPALRARPIVVAAPGADRATVLALSTEARAAGITRGMPVRLAQKRCPDLVIRPPNPRLYARAWRALHEILARYTPVIEPRWYGHAYLDLTGTGRLFGSAADVAARIAREARERLGLPLSAGVARNKLVSEVASEVVKAACGGPATLRNRGPALLEVGAGDEPAFLAPQRVALLPGLAPDIRERLDDYQLERIGEIAALEPDDLAQVFGPRGRLLHAHARGIDPSPVLPPATRAEFRAVHTLAGDTSDVAVLHRVLRHLTERLGHRLRRRGLAARRLTVHLAWTDYATAKRSVPLAPAALDIELYDAARRALVLANRRRVAVRAVGVTVDRFLEAGDQLELWDEGADRTGGDGPGEGALVRVGLEGRASDRAVRLQHAIDRIRTRWGATGIRHEHGCRRGP